MAKHVILALFADEAAAEAAAASLEAWDKDEKSITLDTVAVLTVDEKGKLKSSVPGRVATAAKGAGAGVVITVLFGTLIGGPLFLPIAGGVLGAISGKGLGLKTEDRERIAGELAGGKAAVGVLVGDLKAADVSAKLTELGGAAESHEVPADVEADIDEAISQS